MSDTEKEKYRPIGMICDYDEDIEKYYKTPPYLDEDLNYHALTPDGEMFKVSERFLWVMFSCPLQEQCLLFGFEEETETYTVHYQALYGAKKRYELIGVGKDIYQAYAEMLVYFALLYQNFDDSIFNDYVKKEMKDEQIGEFNFNPPPKDELPEEFFQAQEIFVY